jgi:hypothetical protein
MSEPCEMSDALRCTVVANYLLAKMEIPAGDFYDKLWSILYEFFMSTSTECLETMKGVANRNEAAP